MNKEKKANTLAMLKLVSDIKPSFFPLTILEGLLATGIVFLNIILSAKILDGIVDGNETELIQLALLLVGLNMVLALARWAINKVLIVMRREIDDTVVKQVCEKCLTLDYQIMEKTGTLDYIYRAREGSNANGGVTGYCTTISSVISCGITMMYSIVIMIRFFTSESTQGSSSFLQFVSSPWAGILMLALMGIVVFLRWLLARKTNEMQYAFFEDNVKSNREFSSYFEFLYDYQIGKQVRIYNMLPLIKSKLERLTTYQNGRASTLLNGFIWLNVSSEVIAGVLLLICYGFVGLKAVSGAISVGEMTLYVGTLTSFSDAMSQIFGRLSELSIHNHYLSNYTSFLALKNEKYDGTLPIEKRLDNDYELEFKNVSFHYPNSDDMVLKNITAKIRVGRKMAIVGKNGSGKSTFIKLLCRLYDPTEGEILLNGIDIKKYDYDEYRQIFGVVFQDFQLFSYPVAQNVAAGFEYDEEKVWKALEQAGMAERVRNMEKGLETVIYKQEDEGVEISGGEAQKLAIARALYKDAPVVILDEPTAALDPVSELEIYERFDEMVKEKTAIYISHRMSSCRFCENILVFDEGNIAQMGSHEGLVKEDGLYARLWEAQAQYYS